MATGYGVKSIVTNGLVFCTDAKNTKSYIGSGTTLTDIANKKTGTISGATFSNGIFTYDGTNDKTSFTSTGLSSTTTNLTINTWIKTDDKTADNGAYRGWITTGAGSSNTACFKMSITNDNGYCVIWGLNNSAKVTADTALDGDTWFNVVYTYTSGTGKIYTNGALDATASYTGNHDLTQFHLGSGGTAGNLDDRGMWNGEIGPVHVYNRELTATEVLQNFNAQRGRFGV